MQNLSWQILVILYTLIPHEHHIYTSPVPFKSTRGIELVCSSGRRVVNQTADRACIAQRKGLKAIVNRVYDTYQVALWWLSHVSAAGDLCLVTVDVSLHLLQTHTHKTLLYFCLLQNKSTSAKEAQHTRHGYLSPRRLCTYTQCTKHEEHLPDIVLRAEALQFWTQPGAPST